MKLSACLPVDLVDSGSAHALRCVQDLLGHERLGDEAIGSVEAHVELGLARVHLHQLDCLVGDLLHFFLVDGLHTLVHVADKVTQRTLQDHRLVVELKEKRAEFNIYFRNS